MLFKATEPPFYYRNKANKTDIMTTSLIFVVEKTRVLFSLAGNVLFKNVPFFM